MGFGMGDQFRDRLGRKRRIDHEHEGAADQARDRCHVAEQAEIQLVIKRRVDGIGCRGQVNRIAVGRRTHDRLGTDIAGGAGPVLDDELLTEPLRQPRTQQARQNIRRASGRSRYDPVHRPRRVDLRPSLARHNRQRDSARSQMQKLPSVGKCHGGPPICKPRGLRHVPMAALNKDYPDCSPSRKGMKWSLMALRGQSVIFCRQIIRPSHQRI
jgi:hypothetical protein